MAHNLSSPLPKMMPRDFLRQLPKVHDLTPDDNCPICMDKYEPRKAPAPGIISRIVSMAIWREPEKVECEEFDRAVRLPCQHVVGKKCITRWISPAEGEQSRCPYVSSPNSLERKKPTENHADRRNDIVPAAAFHTVEISSKHSSTLGAADRSLSFIRANHDSSWMALGPDSRRSRHECTRHTGLGADCA